MGIQRDSSRVFISMLFDIPKLAEDVEHIGTFRHYSLLFQLRYNPTRLDMKRLFGSVTEKEKQGINPRQLPAKNRYLKYDYVGDSYGLLNNIQVVNMSFFFFFFLFFFLFFIFIFNFLP